MKSIRIKKTKSMQMNKMHLTLYLFFMILFQKNSLNLEWIFRKYIHIYLIYKILVLSEVHFLLKQNECYHRDLNYLQDCSSNCGIFIDICPIFWNSKKWGIIIIICYRNSNCWISWSATSIKCSNRNFIQLILFSIKANTGI